MQHILYFHFKPVIDANTLRENELYVFAIVFAQSARLRMNLKEILSERQKTEAVIRYDFLLVYISYSKCRAYQEQSPCNLIHEPIKTIETVINNDIRV